MFKLDLEKAEEPVQAGIKIAGRNINNLIYAVNTTLMVESEEELRSLLMKVKEEIGKGWFISMTKKAVSRNAQTKAQLHSCHTLAK